MSEELSFYEVHGSDGRLRIAVDDGSDEPPFMQSAGRCAPGSAMFRIVSAVALASNPERDEHGLWWPTKLAAKKALAAARKAANAEKMR